MNIQQQDEDRHFQTESRGNYQNMPYAARQRAIPIAATLGPDYNARFSGTSQTRDAHSGFPEARPAEPFRPPPGVPLPHEARDFHTEASSHFNNKGVAVRGLIAPPPGLPPLDPQPFAGVSATKDEYRNWGKIQPPSSFKPQPASFHSEIDTREFKTEAGAHFQRYPNAPYVR
jgi:hypothetical protein